MHLWNLIFYLRWHWCHPLSLNALISSFSLNVLIKFLLLDVLIKSLLLDVLIKSHLVPQMLNCIIGMVDKTRRALTVLQERSLRDRDELSIWMRRNGEGDSDSNKRSPDGWSRSEERISDVRRRAGRFGEILVTKCEPFTALTIKAPKAKLSSAICGQCSYRSACALWPKS